MAARGTQAKEFVTKKIMEAFGQNFIGTYDKKLYINAPENGELIQVAISLTCPKTPVEFTGSVQTGDFNFEDVEPTVMSAAAGPATVEVTAEEKQTIEDLMKRLGL
jgi:hypothetical protein